jgi:hypothetical protein
LFTQKNKHQLEFPSIQIVEEQKKICLLLPSLIGHKTFGGGGNSRTIAKSRVDQESCRCLANTTGVRSLYIRKEVNKQ